jgi:hypothetical protein
VLGRRSLVNPHEHLNSSTLQVRPQATRIVCANNAFDAGGGKCAFCDLGLMAMQKCARPNKSVIARTTGHVVS